MKIVLSNKVYVKVPEDLAETLKKLFTFEIPDPFNSSKPNYIPRYVGQAMSLNKETLTISRGHFESVKSAILSSIPNTEFNIIDRTISVPVKIPSPSFILRQDQSNVVNQFEEGITRNINDTIFIWVVNTFKHVASTSGWVSLAFYSCPFLISTYFCICKCSFVNAKSCTT